MYLALTSLINNETITTGLRVSKSMTIRGLRLGLYKHNTPNGTLTLDIYDGATKIGTSNVTMTALDTAVGTYFHGMILFDLGDSGLRINKDPETTYKELSLKITLSSHTDDTNNYLGLINQPVAAQFVDSFGNYHDPSQTDEQLTYSQPYQIEIYKIGNI